MKVISKEEEREHFGHVMRGGLIGGSAGLAVGLVGVWGASRRYAVVRSLTLPFKSFLVSSSATFGAIVVAERHSIRFQRSHDPMNNYLEDAQRAAEEARRTQRTEAQRMLDWAREHRYSIVFASWVASMAIALSIVGRSKYMSTSQKVVQARVYAQGLTLAVLIATAALETADAKAGKGRWETVMVADPNDPTHQTMIERKVHKEDYEGQDLWKGAVPPPPHSSPPKDGIDTRFCSLFGKALRNKLTQPIRDGRRRGEAAQRAKEAARGAREAGGKQGSRLLIQYPPAEHTRVSRIKHAEAHNFF